MGNLPNYAVFLLLLATVLGFLFNALYHQIFEPHPVPKVEDEFWGPNSEQNLPEDTAIQPFKIEIAPFVIGDLNRRLERELNSSNSRLPPPLEGINFEYGFNTKWLQVVGQYWLNEYNWKERQKILNKYPHFKTKIGGLDVHFQHIKSRNKNKETRPLLILHGWPGSFVELQKLIPILIDSHSCKYSYELVVPSLPGFAFSSAPARPGLSSPEMANIFKRLMTRLGYEKYFAMGGDLGSTIVTDMAILYPEKVIAAQCNACYSYTVSAAIKYSLATTFPSIFRTERDRHAKVLSVFDQTALMIQESGYFHLQATKPDTIGAGLSHSPLGLVAHVLGKISGSTNRTWASREDGGLLEKFSMDELLDYVMIHWVTGSITSSFRFYKEQVNPSKKHQLDRVPTSVPFSIQYMAEEIYIIPEYALQHKYLNIPSYTIESRGGHIAAFEEPELVAQNVIAHFNNY